MSPVLNVERDPPLRRDVVVHGACPICGKLVIPSRSSVLKGWVLCCEDRYRVPLYKVKVKVKT